MHIEEAVNAGPVNIENYALTVVQYYDYVRTNKYVMIFGGNNSITKELCNDLWIYDRSKQKWTLKSSPFCITMHARADKSGQGQLFPCPRTHAKIIYHAAVDKLFVIGGNTNDNILRDIWQYCNASNAWECLLTDNRAKELLRNDELESTIICTDIIVDKAIVGIRLHFAHTILIHCYEYWFGLELKLVPLSGIDENVDGAEICEHLADGQVLYLFNIYGTSANKINGVWIINFSDKNTSWKQLTKFNFPGDVLSRGYDDFIVAIEPKKKTICCIFKAKRTYHNVRAISCLKFKLSTCADGHNWGLDIFDFPVTEPNSLRVSFIYQQYNHQSVDFAYFKSDNVTGFMKLHYYGITHQNVGAYNHHYDNHIYTPRGTVPRVYFELTDGMYFSNGIDSYVIARFPTLCSSIIFTSGLYILKLNKSSVEACISFSQFIYGELCSIRTLFVALELFELSQSYELDDLKVISFSYIKTFVVNIKPSKPVQDIVVTYLADKRDCVSCIRELFVAMIKLRRDWVLDEFLERNSPNVLATIIATKSIALDRSAFEEPFLFELRDQKQLFFVHMNQLDKSGTDVCLISLDDKRIPIHGIMLFANSNKMIRLASHCKVTNFVAELRIGYASTIIQSIVDTIYNNYMDMPKIEESLLCSMLLFAEDYEMETVKLQLENELCSRMHNKKEIKRVAKIVRSDRLLDHLRQSKHIFNDENFKKRRREAHAHESNKKIKR